MSDSSRRRTFSLPLLKIGSALPAFALISSGILLAASAAPPPGLRIGPDSSSSPAIVVPDIALTLPGPGRAVVDAAAAAAARVTPSAQVPVASSPKPPVSMLPPGVSPGSSYPVTLDRAGIPARALEGYRGAVPLVNAADPACHIDWALLAAIGRVESDHARFGGNQLDQAGVARPGIIGIPLDGSNGTARITDTDGGLLDRDVTYDRAVGPMQFIPSTWRVAGADGNGDQVKNPQNMADAATATAIYLCSGPGDLSRPDDLRGAILRYNASDSYAQMVTAIASAYRHGVTALPASDLAPASPTSATSRAARPATKRAPAASGTPAAHRAGSTPAKPAGPKPAGTSPAPATIPPVATPGLPSPTKAPPAVPQPAKPIPTAPTSTTPSPTTPAPTTPSPTTPSPTTPAPTPTCEPATPAPTGSLPAPPPAGTAPPTPAEPCLPVPCLPAPAPGSTAPPSPAPPVPCPTPTTDTAPSTPVAPSTSAA